MRKTVVTRAAFILCAFGLSAACIGCEGARDNNEGATAASSSQGLTVFECNEQLSSCVGAATTISDLAACNEAYGTCLIGSAEEFVVGLPTQVTTAITDVDSCNSALAQCVASATTPSELIACQEDEAACLAGVLNVTLPTAPASALASCSEDAAQCVGSATTLADLSACSETFTTCAAAAATATASDILPTSFTDVINDAGVCLDDLRTCVSAAQAPSDLVACEETETACLASSLGVTLPDLSVATTCAEDATTCVANASTLADVTACANTFAACAGGFATDVITGLPLPQELTDAFTALAACNTTLDACVQAAQSPSDLTACQEQGATCVGTALGLALPTGADIIGCTDTASQCVLAATTLTEFQGCVDGLATCVGPAPSSGATTIDCAAQFTQCVATNPFGLLQCADQERLCLAGTP